MLNNVIGVLGTPTPPVTNSYESIATVTVSSGAPTTITFSSIPSTYKHLQIRAVAAKGGTNDWAYMTVNGDTASNYSYHYLLGNGSSASAGSGVSTAYLLTSIGYNSTTTFAGTVIDLLDYANTSKYKTTRALVGIDNNGSGEIYLTSGSWRSTSVISSITFTTSSGTGFSNGTTYALYGIKG